MIDLRTAEEWCVAMDVAVIDPDGWRKNDGVTWETQISREDFEARAAASTTRTPRVQPPAKARRRTRKA